MGYVRIKIQLKDGQTRSGIRHFPEPMKLEEIRSHARHLAAEALGRDSIVEVTVEAIPADDPAVVAFILSERSRRQGIPSSDGEHPYLKQQLRRPPR